ncbi:MAG: hypothetical protein LBI60_03925 [Bacteroidales bacterium]|jgi:hypothetical protein|nr:hypothetical protein [Bacteroidales bacterium]
MTRYFLFFLFGITLFTQKAFSQIETRVSRTDSAGLFVMLNPNFTYNIVMADLSKDYGNNLAIGMDIGLKTKSNWSIDFGFKYHFGGKVRQHLVDSAFKYLTVDGYFISSNGVATTEIEVEFRGVSFHLQAGKIIPVTKRYRNSGIWIKAGIGVTQHQMHIKNPEEKVPHLAKDYKKGYDKLTIGFSLYQFIGYAHINRRNLFCMYGGVEFMENFAKRQREYDYSMMKKDNSKRFESMVGFKIGWIIPLYKHNPNTIFYYR